MGEHKAPTAIGGGTARRVIARPKRTSANQRQRDQDGLAKRVGAGSVAEVARNRLYRITNKTGAAVGGSCVSRVMR